MNPSLPFIVIACTITLAIGGAASASTAVLPADPAYVHSLDGTWRFKLEQAGDHPEHGKRRGGIEPIVRPEHPEPFQKLDYKEDSTWRDMKVPSNWEMSGYSPATYDQPDNAIGIYRLWFDVPADWNGRLVKLNFDGVQNGAEIFLNGQPVDVSEPAWGRKNYHEGGWDAFQVDLTPAVKFGAKNLLAIRVTKNTKSSDMDTGDYFFLGGIHRPVTLYSVPKMHLSDYFVRTKLLGGGKAEVRVLVDLENPTADGQVTLHLKDQPPVQAQVNSQTHIEIVQTLDHPRLWSAEHPNLYEMSLDLKSGDKTIEHVEKKIGVREVSIKNGVLLVNGVPVKLAGICRHDIYPTLGTAIDASVWRKDIELMKAANINAIRTSHYPYGSGFYDLCDEMGMYVADEMAACWVPTNTDELTPRFAQHARELVERDKNHPSVIIWAVGNENKVGKNNKVAADEIHRLDPTRPRLVSTHNADEAGVELDDRHYTTPAGIRKDIANTARRAKYPAIYLEDPNDWEVRNGADFGNTDRWAAVLNRTWKAAYESKHVPGIFLWEWQDRAIDDSKNPVHLYDYDPATDISLVKVKGICDGYRTPRPWYYHVKMSYAPIRVDLKPVINSDSVQVKIDNRYSFTNLSELAMNWHLVQAGKDIQSGTMHPPVPPLAQADIKLPLPADALKQADSLRLEFNHPGGGNVVTYLLDLRPHKTAAPEMDAHDLAGINFPRLNLTDVDYRNNDIGWRTAHRHPAKLVNIKLMRASDPSHQVSVDQAELEKTALASVRAVDAEMVIDGFVPMQPRRKKNRKNRAPESSEVVHVGTIHAEFDQGRFSCSIHWTAPQADIQELGWIFTMPNSFDHFSWDRNAYWSWYPSDHIGRPHGTATPDSAKQDVTRITRPDAFDFNSSKYNCNWASLCDESGKGICASFAAGDRAQCRGGIGADGTYELIVNKVCAPPRDISTPVVADYYFTLKPGEKVEQAFTVGRVR